MSTFVFINRFQGVNMGNWHIWKNQHGQLTQMLSSTKNRSLIDAQWHLTLLFPLTIIWNTMYGTNYCQTADALQILKGLWKSAHYKHILAWLFFSDWVVAPSSLGTGPSLVGVSLQHLLDRWPSDRNLWQHSSVLTIVHTHRVYKKAAEERHIYSYSISILAVSIFDQYI